jgi:hypothetical protein
MSYMLLIVEPPGQRQERGREAGEAAYDHMLEYSRTLKERGVLIATNSLKSGGARLSIRGGKSQVVDGPFTEAKEIVGGFFLLDVQTLEAALALAAECPAARFATVEVREIGPCYE